MPFHDNKPYQFELGTDAVTITISADGVSRHVKRSYNITRDYILSRYNWNAIMKMMGFIYEKHNEVFELPEDLSGTEEDNKHLIPNRAIAFVLSLQLEAICKRPKPNGSNLDAILHKADGKPGPSFCRSILKKERLVFLNETFNKTQKDPVSGEKLIPPSSGAAPSDFYHFFKKIVEIRNGIWSSKPGVVNLIGLRRVLRQNRSTDAGYNDTIASCWLDDQGLPQCELNIATTEPGNRVSSRELFPQTMTMVVGYHNMRQPGGRTRNALKEGSNQAINSGRGNDLKPTWNPGDTTMNFHQGGNNFLYPLLHPNLKGKKATNDRKIWLSYFGLNSDMQKGIPSRKADQEALFQLNLVLSEIYLILSRYGKDREQAAYKNLEELAKHPPISKSAIQGGMITVSQQGFRNKVINVAHVKQRTLRIWFDGRRKESSKKKIYEILAHVSDYTPAEIKSWHNFTEAQVLAKLKDEHVEKIIEIQSEFLGKMTDGVDGIAGNQFYSMITGIYQKTSAAKEDKARIDVLFEQLKNSPLNVSVINRLKKFMRIRTYTNRKNVRDNTKHIAAKDLDVVDNVDVGRYSAGCQVFYDTEVFYTFWTKLLKRAEKSGQRRWYYTLVDATNFRKSDVM